MIPQYLRHCAAPCCSLTGFLLYIYTHAHMYIHVDLLLLGFLLSTIQEIASWWHNYRYFVLENYYQELKTSDFPLPVSLLSNRNWQFLFEFCYIDLIFLQEEELKLLLEIDYCNWFSLDKGYCSVKMYCLCCTAITCYNTEQPSTPLNELSIIKLHVLSYN